MSLGPGDGILFLFVLLYFSSSFEKNSRFGAEIAAPTKTTIAKTNTIPPKTPSTSCTQPSFLAVSHLDLAVRRF